jgi:sulfopyruvate decarboxylase TPP-binding subunit
MSDELLPSGQLTGPAGTVAGLPARSPASEILAALDDLEIDFLVYIPCSTARPLLERLTPRLGARAFVASVESEAVAIGTGLALAGRRPLLLMQDTGLGNALTVLTTLPKAYHVPLLILATRTGGLREINAVVHEYSDGVPALLDACRVPHFGLDYRVPLGAWRGVVTEAGRASRLARRPTVVLADLKAGHPEALTPRPPLPQAGEGESS